MKLDALQNLDTDQRLAITVYFELLLVSLDMQTDYIKKNFPTENTFWNTLESTNIELPYLVRSQGVNGC